MLPLWTGGFSGADREARYTSAERDHEHEACEEKLICPFCQWHNLHSAYNSSWIYCVQNNY